MNRGKVATGLKVKSSGGHIFFLLVPHLPTVCGKGTNCQYLCKSTVPTMLHE